VPLVKVFTARLIGLVALGAAACSNTIASAPGLAPASGGGAGTGMMGMGGMSTGGTTGAALSCDVTNPGVAPLRLLTHLQYDNTVADLLGDTTHPSSQFPAENVVLGFSNNVAANQANPSLIAAYQAAAESLATTAVSTNLTTLAPCADGTDNGTCGHTFVQTFGAKVFRRALTDGEAGIFDALFDATLSQGYSKAIELTLRAMLQSPQFLYRVDAVHAATAETGAVALGPNELASRLSYFLTNSTPDDTLLAAAANNQLVTPTDVETQARRLLETPRAKQMAEDFVGQWLGLAQLNGAARQAPDESYGPTELVPDWQASFSSFIDDAIWNDGTINAFFSSPKLFVSGKLASLYGVTQPSDPTEPVSVPTERAGIITQPAIMALLAHSDQSGPVQRGVFVLEDLLCIAVAPPPPNVVAVPPAVDETATTRERFTEHISDPSCSSCHIPLDGIGFGFEQYDQLGRYRDTENGLPVDASGEVVGTGDPALDGPFNGALELAGRLANDQTARDCLATQWYRYAMGRVEDSTDTCSLTDVKTRFASNNGNFRELLVGITLSDAFLYRPAMENQ
jgi:Protein of unknown function (DUF1592)/Protein of unknown function (DUF1588)/Protein of unknown function (DUF1587)/Protein of unknown function (DUF1585)/Protein of unknown function (DUF1595)